MPCGTHTAANGYHFESYLGRPGRLNLKLEEGKFHEDSCWVIQYKPLWCYHPPYYRASDGIWSGQVGVVLGIEKGTCQKDRPHC
jgi:hypothetical protein